MGGGGGGDRDVVSRLSLARSRSRSLNGTAAVGCEGRGLERAACSIDPATTKVVVD